MKEYWEPPTGWGNYIMREAAEVAMPEPVSFFPETQAWLWLVGLVLLVVTVKSWKILRRWIHNRYRREALALLAEARSGNTISQFPILLKRTAMHAYGREPVASLYGEEWVRFLNDNCKDSPFNEQSCRMLNDLSYGKVRPSVDSDQLADSIELWIKKHPAKEEG
jgi:hypothetical protein